MSRDLLWTPPAFLAALLLIGVPYWRVAYAQADLPDSLYGPGLLVLASLAVMLALFREGRLRTLLLAMASCPAAAVAIRVHADTAADPTSHNLWPFEIVIALVVGAMAVLPALLVGLIARRWTEG